MLAAHNAKLVCTIGPTCGSPEIMLQMLNAGMNIARLNFSHGDFAWRKTAIENLHRTARTAGKRVTIMADLPGPKIRIGLLAEEPIELKRRPSPNAQPGRPRKPNHGRIGVYGSALRKLLKGASWGGRGPPRPPGVLVLAISFTAFSQPLVPQTPASGHDANRLVKRTV